MRERELEGMRHPFALLLILILEAMSCSHPVAMDLDGNVGSGHGTSCKDSLVHDHVISSSSRDGDKVPGE